MELSILFVMAVIVLRGFFLEGFLISTGSMAPGLLGLHKQVSCPSCEYSFAFGVTFDDSVGPDQHSEGLSHNYATCPNCGQANINVHKTPANHGDQLLVHKGFYDFRRPHRWETVVFRNPASPGEAYLKRIVGLPGEHLQVIEGDLYIEGEIARKDLQTQRDMRISVFDIQHVTATDDWQLPWKASGGWRFENGVWHFRSAAAAANNSAATMGPSAAAESGGSNSLNWLQFQNWRWSGGNHFSEVPLLGDDVETDWQNCLKEMEGRPISWMTRLEFDRERAVLRLRGVMPYQMQRDLISWADSTEFRQAVYRLAALSHLSPVTDRYGYNSLVASPEYPVRDLMLEAEIVWVDSPTLIVVRVPVGSEVFRVELDLAESVAALVADETQRSVRTGSLKLPEFTTTQIDRSKLKLEVSNFDHRILVAVNGIRLFEPLDVRCRDTDAISNGTAAGEERFVAGNEDAQRTAEFVRQQNRWALGVAGAAITVTDLKLYRDVHYTPARRRNGVDLPHLVSKNTYFVQGDNSPVSSDSRSWPDPEVPHELLVGKPFIVHLPSKPGKVTIGGFQLPIRIPDFDRIRYIR